MIFLEISKQISVQERSFKAKPVTFKSPLTTQFYTCAGAQEDPVMQYFYK